MSWRRHGGVMEASRAYDRSRVVQTEERMTSQNSPLSLSRSLSSASHRSIECRVVVEPLPSRSAAALAATDRLTDGGVACDPPCGGESGDVEPSSPYSSP